jgi:hypothetical protein
LCLEPLAGIDEHQGVVGGGEGAVGVFAEVGVAGGVEKVDLEARVLIFEGRGEGGEEEEGEDVRSEGWWWRLSEKKQQ